VRTPEGTNERSTPDGEVPPSLERADPLHEARATLSSYVNGVLSGRIPFTPPQLAELERIVAVGQNPYRSNESRSRYARKRREAEKAEQELDLILATIKRTLSPSGWRAFKAEWKIRRERFFDRAGEDDLHAEDGAEAILAPLREAASRQRIGKHGDRGRAAPTFQDAARCLALLLEARRLALPDPLDLDIESYIVREAVAFGPHPLAAKGVYQAITEAYEERESRSWRTELMFIFPGLLRVDLEKRWSELRPEEFTREWFLTDHLNGVVRSPFRSEPLRWWVGSSAYLTHEIAQRFAERQGLPVIPSRCRPRDPPCSDPLDDHDAWWKTGHFAYLCREEAEKMGRLLREPVTRWDPP
jgi:hypothetical protein